MYTQKDCNVREKPSTDYGVMRCLDKVTEVKVTGEVNWYEVRINGEKSYISSSLLADAKPEEIQTSSPSGDTSIPSRDTDKPTPPAETTSGDMYGFTPNGDGTDTDPNGNQCGINSDGFMMPINPDTGMPFETGEKTRSGLTAGQYIPGL